MGLIAYLVSQLKLKFVVSIFQREFHHVAIASFYEFPKLALRDIILEIFYFYQIRTYVFLSFILSFSNYLQMICVSFSHFCQISPLLAKVFIFDV